MGKFIDLTNQKFNRLTALYPTNEYSGSERKWLCECECGNQITARGGHLRNKIIQSCGCLRKELKKKYNRYDLSGQYGIGYTFKGEEFYFDLEDYDKIKDYCWSISRRGYVVSYINKDIPICYLHRLIIKTDKNIDHINHKKYDNRKCNLREVTIQQNNMNQSLKSNNTSGVTGVDFMKKIGKWRARIKANDKEIHIGTFVTFEDAVKARKEAEAMYFGEYSYDNSINLNNV